MNEKIKRFLAKHLGVDENDINYYDDEKHCSMVFQVNNEKSTKYIAKTIGKNRVIIKFKDRGDSGRPFLTSPEKFEDVTFMPWRSSNFSEEPITIDVFKAWMWQWLSTIVPEVLKDSLVQFEADVSDVEQSITEIEEQFDSQTLDNSILTDYTDNKEEYDELLSTYKKLKKAYMIYKAVSKKAIKTLSDDIPIKFSELTGRLNKLRSL